VWTRRSLAVPDADPRAQAAVAAGIADRLEGRLRASIARPARGARGGGAMTAASARRARLLVVAEDGAIVHRGARDLPALVRPGDVVVANDAATLPASLTGRHEPTGAAIEVRLAGRRSLVPQRTRRFVAVAFGDGDHRTPTEHRAPPPARRRGHRLRLGPVDAIVERLLGHPR
jgi:hypothetical protein